MKKFLSVCLFAALATAVHAGQSTATLMAGATNTIAYDGTTWQAGTIAAATTPTTPITNYFNLTIATATGGYSIVNSNAVISTSVVQNGGFTISGGQVNTNQLPAYAINSSPGYPGTIYGSAKTLGIYAQVNLQAAATTPRTFQINWYQSPDGVNAVGVATNYTQTVGVPNLTPAFVEFVTVPAGASEGSCFSNYVVGACQYTLLGQMVNTNEVTGTNITLIPTQQPGL
jgi:hypothetical protein